MSDMGFPCVPLKETSECFHLMQLHTIRRFIQPLSSSSSKATASGTVRVQHQVEKFMR
jgi:hypothetical protein